ncbi:hypothetical protein CGCSCA5_v004485 [Colletotrichum siamense]|nr:hypothetical protein CGCSCA5_v004485 [Colletotrichum siamense]KAI8189765.1 hypothetical protein KHU50_000673 [Colletotrichum sp. SAR 10_65]KAI8231841.1 hypothetical protein K4K54_012664 [Colletotrichum sp. SAR 10_86]KAI8250960.1 hypothetical protein K4K58_009245 [Colletotrichum sp. SAR11_239]
MSLNDPSISKQMRIQIWREEVAASASLCTCPPTSPAASQSSTNISLSASSSSSSAGGSGLGDAFSFPRGDILPSQPTYCPTCSRLGAPSAMGLEPSSAYLDEIQHSGGLLGGGTFGDRRGSLMLFRTKHGNHAIFRGMRNFVRRISGSSSGGGGKNGPLPPRAADEATSMYRRATVAHLSGANKAAAAIAEAEAEAEAAAMDDVESGDVIGEKQARLRRAQRLLVRSHRN